jgi:hypothetical protein
MARFSPSDNIETFPHIPRRPPEEIAAEAAEYWRGDEWRVPTTTLDAVVFKGVKLTSRYNKADEHRVMVELVAALPKSMAARIKSIDHDTKNGGYYVETRRPCSRRFEEQLLEAFKKSKCGGGYVFLRRHDGKLIELY